MKIVADDKIPYIEAPLRSLADEVVMKNGRDIGHEDVRDADILVVRTRTRCDRNLLEGSRVWLVVTATIGYDHLDTVWLERAGIAWANCPGCNATSVGQYVHTSLIQLKRLRGLDLHACTLGIVGVGHVGRAVIEAVRPLGLRAILPNDPPRQAAGAAPPEGLAWCSLEQLQAEADIISFHTPLTYKAPHPTFHLADEAFFRGLRRKPVVVNAARGGVVDEQALIAALENGSVREAVIDTWEHEPDVSIALLHSAFIATPHIAGYSADGKANATRKALAHICLFLGRPMDFDIQPPALPHDFCPNDDPEERALQLYDPMADTARLKHAPDRFEELRSTYPVRREQTDILKMQY